MMDLLYCHLLSFAVELDSLKPTKHLSRIFSFFISCRKINYIPVKSKYFPQRKVLCPKSLTAFNIHSVKENCIL